MNEIEELYNEINNAIAKCDKCEDCEFYEEKGNCQNKRIAKALIDLGYHKTSIECKELFIAKKYIFKIYTFNDDIDKECIGYFDNLEDCVEIVENNCGDIQDHHYRYADIVELPIGIYGYVGECKHHYYKWENGHWNKLDKLPKLPQGDVQRIINEISSYGYKPWIDYGELPIKEE